MPTPQKANCEKVPALENIFHRGIYPLSNGPEIHTIFLRVHFDNNSSMLIVCTPEIQLQKSACPRAYFRLGVSALYLMVLKYTLYSREPISTIVLAMWIVRTPKSNHRKVPPLRTLSIGGIYPLSDGPKIRTIFFIVYISHNNSHVDSVRPPESTCKTLSALKYALASTL